MDARVKPLKAVRDKLALELLYHGGLAAERLGLEGEEFYEGIRRLYSQLPIQSLSASSFKDSIVPVPNLVALAELNDMGAKPSLVSGLREQSSKKKRTLTSRKSIRRRTWDDLVSV